jgi:hypothetical protein
LASLPPLVNTISSVRQPSNSATWSRAFSNAAFAGASPIAARWVAEGLL